MINIEINWDEIPDSVSKEQMCKICHIAKDTASRLLREGFIPCEYTGKKTRCFSISKEALRCFVESSVFRNRTYFINDKEVKRACAVLSADDLSADIFIAMKTFFTRKLLGVPDVLTVRELSELIGYGRNQINRWCSSGKLKCFKRQNSHYIPKTFLIDFLCSQTFRAVKNKSEWHQKAVFDFSRLVKLPEE